MVQRKCYLRTRTLLGPRECSLPLLLSLGSQVPMATGRHSGGFGGNGEVSVSGQVLGGGGRLLEGGEV